MDKQIVLEHEIEMREMMDETIKSVCKKIQENDVMPEDYADTVNALAELIKARNNRN